MKFGSNVGTATISHTPNKSALPLNNMHMQSPGVRRRNFLAGICSAAALANLSKNSSAADTTLPAANPTGADVGTLFPVINAQAVKTDFPLSFLNKNFKSIKPWKKKARVKVLDLLAYSPAKCDPKAEIVERVDKGDFIREKIYFNTAPGVRVPAYLLIPKLAAGKRLPALVALHDHGGYYIWGKEKLVETENEHPAMKEWRKTYYGNTSIAADLAKQGYVVLVIDMFYWGERRMLLDNDPADWRDRPIDMSAARINEFNRRSSQSEQLVGRTIFSAGFTWAGLMYWDDIRSVDYLVTRPEVDPARIGCVGLSVGSVRSAHLAALDDRIKAAVAVCWMCSFPAQLKKKVVNTIGHTKVIPGLYRHMDYPDLASLAMPSALLVINGKRDGLFDQPGVDAAFQKLHACYQKAGLPEKIQTTHYDSPHEFNPAMQQEAWAWLKRWV
jgi:dienelactone hydrolase